MRIAAVVALRRMKDPSVARFLADQDEYIVTEAARAINDDGGIEGALPPLAAALDGKVTNEPFVRRAINANLRVGTAEAARRVAAYAGGTGATDEMRVEAVAVLGVWPKPSILDRVDGYSHGPVQHDTGAAVGSRARHAAARAALASIVTPLFASGSTALQVALADAVGRLRVHRGGPTLYAKLQHRAGARRSASPRCARSVARRRARRRSGPRRVAGSGIDAAHGGAHGISPLNLPEATTTSCSRR